MRSFFETAFPATSDRGAFAPQPSTDKTGGALAANVAQQIPIPAGARYVLSTFNGDFYQRFGVDNLVAAAIPAGFAAPTTGVAELNPGMRRIPDDATYMSLIAPAACQGTVSFWGA